MPILIALVAKRARWGSLGGVGGGRVARDGGLKSIIFDGGLEGDRRLGDVAVNIHLVIT